jgi:hypothetical protein
VITLPLLALVPAELLTFTALQSLLRALIAAAAMGLLLWAAPGGRWVRGTLVALALLALGCYYHFGVPQFWDAAKSRPTFVHATDMRHYFPLAKYFAELRFDGLYAASMAAYIELNAGMTVLDVKDVRFRDLRTYEMRTVAQLAPHIEEVRARFSPGRWEDFTRDMRYFLDSMGRGRYLNGMVDHGANATPVWILAAHLLFRRAPASELTLSLGALIDLLLIASTLIAIWRTFGLRVACYVTIVFGATDFYQLRTNLVGSTLRQDWLAALGLGACALRTGRSFLGGALIAYAGLIRAFPAIATVFLAAPLVWWLVDRVRHSRRLPSLAHLRQEQAPALRALAGAAVTVVALLAVTSLLFGWSPAWGNWFTKIELHAGTPGANSVGLQNILMFEPGRAAKQALGEVSDEPWLGWRYQQLATFERRKPLFYLGATLFVALVFLACRGRALEQAALLGLTTVPVLFYPSNYYCHFIFLLPLAVAPRERDALRERTFVVSVAALLGLCVAQYFTLAERSLDLRYTYQSVALLAGLVVFLALPAWTAARRMGQLPPMLSRS